MTLQIFLRLGLRRGGQRDTEENEVSIDRWKKATNSIKTAPFILFRSPHGISRLATDSADVSGSPAAKMFFMSSDDEEQHGAFR